MDICKDGIWGSVCHNGWGNADARVVCRQLGFSIAGMYNYYRITIYFNTLGSIALPAVYTGHDTGPIVLDFVACIGNEERLLECRAGSINPSCTHSHDARVRCQLRTGESRSLLIE